MKVTALRGAPWKLGGICGVLFVALSFLAAAINVEPPSYDRGTGYAEWFSENGDRYRGGHLLAGLAFLLFYFPFFASLCEQLRLAEGTPAIWSRVAWAGAIASPVVGTISGALKIGLSLASDNVSDETASFALAAAFYALIVSGALAGVALLGSAIVVLRTRVFPAWLAWVAAVLGLAGVASTAAIVEDDPDGWFAAMNGLVWILYFAWIAVVGVIQIRATPATAATP